MDKHPADDGHGTERQKPSGFISMGALIGIGAGMLAVAAVAAPRSPIWPDAGYILSESRRP